MLPTAFDCDLLLAHFDSMLLLCPESQGPLERATQEPELTTVRRRGRRACSSRSSATRSSSSLPSSTNHGSTAEKALSALAPRKVLPQPMDCGCFRGFTCRALPGEAQACS